MKGEVSYPVLLIFRSGSKSDYHDRNHANNKKWLQETLMPNLESKSVIVRLTTMYSSTGTQPAMPEKVN